MLGPDRGACSVLTGPPSSSFQNFVQIISNLLAEENRDKWEEAQLVRTQGGCSWSEQQLGTGVGGASRRPGLWPWVGPRVRIPAQPLPAV